MFNATFFEHIEILKDRYYTDYQFNLFTVLRSSSDEVRLHSRFISEILNPSGSHGFGSVFLEEFLSTLNIHSKITETVTVHSEYKNIDILIRCGKSAIVIENKIHAGDQPQQLKRYLDAMVSEGVQDINLIYVTLTGIYPSKQSIDGIAEDYLNSDKFHCLSYRDEIHAWITRCQQKAVNKPALRESFSQYLEVIEKLTSKVRNDKYMTELKSLLKREDNLTNFLDLQQAYQSVLLDLQVKLWDTLQEAACVSLEGLGELDERSRFFVENKRATIQKLVEKRNGSNYFGLYYSLEGMPYMIGIEMQGSGIIVGISCNKDTYPEAYSKAEHRWDGNGWLSSKFWPCYTFIDEKVNYREPQKSDLIFLASDKERKKAAEKVSEFIERIKR